jgi:protocatechuate 3,4-dioxygenase beta subunit
MSNATGEQPHGRFRNWMLTGEKGRNRLQKIKPAPFPGRTTPTHIHYTLTGKTFKEDRIDSVMFEGDELITEEVTRELKGKGGFEPVDKLKKKADGIL